MRKFLQRRRERLDRAEFRKGFGWAMTTYYIERVSLDHIHVVASMETDQFYCGVVHAIETISCATTRCEAQPRTAYIKGVFNS